jgi:hypothetical protein
MDQSAVGRVLIAVVLLGGVLGLCVHYGSVSGERYPYPSPGDLKTAPSDHVGTQVFVFGTVEEIDSTENTARIRVDTDRGSFTADVTEFSTQREVRSGGVVQVYGQFQSGYRIDADTVRVVNPSGASGMYKYIVSALAAGIILILFFRSWRVNIRTLSVEGR